MLVRHLPPALDSLTYTAPVTARGRVILEHHRSRQLWTYIPQRNVIVHSAQHGASGQKLPVVNAMAALLRNYDLTASPSPVLAAGRKTYVVTLRSKRPHRPFSRLWIDPYTGLVLRRETYHSDASLSTVTYFSEIKLKPSPTQAQFSPAQWDSRRPRLVEAHAPGDLDETGTDLDHLPAELKGKAVAPQQIDGYQLQSATLLHRRTHTALHLLYTDGLNQISVYELRSRIAPDSRLEQSQAIRINAVQTARVQRAYSYTVLSWNVADMEYSVVADLSVQSLRRFAAALIQLRA